MKWARTIAIAGSLALIGTLLTPADTQARGRDITGVMIDLDDHVPFEIDHRFAAERVELIIHRLTKGLYQDDADKRFKPLADQAHAHKIRFGAYHLLWHSPDGQDNGEQQAKDFLRAVRERCNPGQRMLLAIDWEEVQCRKDNKRVPCGIPDPKLLKSFLSYFKNHFKQKILVYTSGRVLREQAAAIEADPELRALLRDNPLWFTQPARDFTPASDKTLRRGLFFPGKQDHQPWDGWTFWQFAFEERKDEPPVSGLAMEVAGRRVDLNWFNGDRETFRRFYDRNAVALECRRP